MLFLYIAYSLPKNRATSLLTSKYRMKFPAPGWFARVGLNVAGPTRELQGVVSLRGFSLYASTKTSCGAVLIFPNR